jgi:small subunit ribosomal protein S8
MPTSKMKVEIANILKSEGFIKEYVVEDRTLTLTLKYSDNKERVISGLKCISKPGLRVYAKAEDIPRVLNGLGIAIISTSKGVMTDKEARKQSIGGEVLAYIW